MNISSINLISNPTLSVNLSNSKTVQGNIALDISNTTFINGSNTYTAYDTAGNGSWKVYTTLNTSINAVNGASAASEWTQGTIIPFVTPPNLYYDFNTSSGSTILNLGTNTYDATLVRSSLSSTSPSPSGGSYLNLNNTEQYNNAGSQYVQLPPITITSTGFSIAFWLNVTNSNNAGYLFDFATAPAQYSQNMICHTSGTTLVLFPNISDAGVPIQTGSGIFSNNTWTHICITIDSSKNIIFYKNGVSFHTGLAPANPFSNPNKTSCMIGTTYFPNVGFVGGIDNFMIFNKHLSSAEVGDLYSNSGSVNLFALTGSGATMVVKPATPISSSETNYTLKSTEIALKPGTSNNIYSVWTAPSLSNIYVDVSFANYNARSNGVGFQIFKINNDDTFGSVVFGRTVTTNALTNAAPTNYLTVPAAKLSVCAGDKLYFRADNNGNTTSSSCLLSVNLTSYTGLW